MQALLQRIGIARERGRAAGRRRPRDGRERLRPRRCGRPPRPTLGERIADAEFAAHADAALADTRRDRSRQSPRRKRSRSRSRCARPSSTKARPPRWSRPTARSRAACSRRSRAGTSRSTIPAAIALADTPAGVFARLAAEAALGGLAPVTLLALLKHPLLRLGAPAGAHARAIAALERAVLRGPRPRPGTAGLAHALKTLPRGACQAAARGAIRICIRSDPRATLADERPRRRPPNLVDRADGRARAARRHCAPGRSPSPSSRRATAAVIERSPMTAPARRRLRRRRRHGARRRRSTRSRRARRRRFARSCSADYPELFDAVDRATAWCAGRARRARACASYGPLEARLHHVDRVVLGGLVEGVLAAGDAQRSVAQPPDAARRSASICRSGASGSRRTTSRRCSARAR